jgi:hypothetical protein
MCDTQTAKDAQKGPGNPDCSIKEVARDSCSSTRLGTHRYSGDDSQPGCGTQANTYLAKALPCSCAEQERSIGLLQ